MPHDMRSVLAASRYLLAKAKSSAGEGIWRTTDDGSKIFIQDGVAYGGGPSGPVLGGKKPTKKEQANKTKKDRPSSGGTTPKPMAKKTQRETNGKNEMLSEEIKDAVGSAFSLIYEFGENRDDVLDNLNSKVNHLLNKDNVSDFFDYRAEVEARYEQAATNKKPRKRYEETIESHVDSHVAGAIDQSEEYGGLEGAFHSYSQNVYDTLLEDGYTGKEAMEGRSLFAVKFMKATGLEL